MLLLCFTVDPPVLPIKTKALWAKRGEAAPVARPLTARAAAIGEERPEDQTIEDVPLRSRVTIARRGAPASRAPFGRTSPIAPQRAAVAPSGLLKRSGQTVEGVPPKRTRVDARDVPRSPDVQSVAPAERVTRTSPLEVSSSGGEDQGVSSRRSDKCK